MEERITIRGMSCGHCVQAVTEALQKLDGIEQINVSLEDGQASFQNTKGLKVETIKAAITKIGFQVD